MRKTESGGKLYRKIVDAIMAVAGGQPSVSEALGHREFILTYKAFDPVGPACLPVAARSR